MNVREKLSPYCVDAQYLASQIPHFAGNQLIEALPAVQEPGELLVSLSSKPAFALEQRQLPTSQRLQMLKSLSSFLFPLERHIALATELDSLLRNGYVSRRPATPEHAMKMMQIHEQTHIHGTYALQDLSHWEQQSGLLLIGVSGMGKTRFIKRWASRLPKVIYHPELHIYQIPVLHIELPADGESVTGLCAAIFAAIDKLIPGSNYVETYSLRGRPTVEQLIRRVEAVMHAHCVGMLICDEVQNLSNAGKSKGRLMTELVSMSNLLSIPLVFIGTNKAAKLFGLDFRKSRRVSGFGSQHWERLHEGIRREDGALASEWRDFLAFMWRFQWTRHDAALTEEIRATMYQCCQGVIDIAIKLFAAAQARAILDGTEQIQVRHIRESFKEDFKLIQPMVEELRRNDATTLSLYEDIAPLNLGALVDTLQDRSRAALGPAFAITPESEDFPGRVVASLVAAGIPEETAWSVFKEVASEGRAQNLSDAMSLCMNRLSPASKPLAVLSKKRQIAAAPTSTQSEPADNPPRPGDIRSFVVQAKNSGRSLIEVMKEAGALRSVEEILESIKAA